MKRLIATILTMVLIFGLMGCSGGNNSPPKGLEENPASDFEYRYVAELNGIEIFNYTGTSIKVRIPEKIEGEPVTSIGATGYLDDYKGTFQDSAIMEVYIPNSVTRIAFWAFKNCRELMNLTIGNNVDVDAEAFYYCTGLTSVTIGNNVTLDYDVFYGCINLTSVVIGNNVTVGNGAFNACRALTNVSIRNGSLLNYRAFVDCTALTSVTMNGDVRVDYEAFSGCTALKSIKVDRGTKSIGDDFFDIATGVRNFHEVYP